MIATGVQHSVREFADTAARKMGLDLEWRGSGVDEHAVVAGYEIDYPGIEQGDVLVRVDERYYRPAEVDTLLGDASLARTRLGWEPRIGFDELVEEMAQSDLKLAREEALVRRDRERG